MVDENGRQPAPEEVWFKRFGFEENPFDERNTNAELLYGYEDVITTLKNYIESDAYVSVWAPSGRGKTIVLNKLKEMFDKTHEFDVVRIPFDGIRSYQDFFTQFQKVAETTNPIVKLFNSIFSGKKEDRIDRKIVKAYPKNGPKKLLILADEIGMLESEFGAIPERDAEDIARTFSYLYNESNTRVVFSSIKPAETIRFFTESFRSSRICSSFELRPPSVAEIKGMLEKRTGNKQLPVTEGAVAYLASESNYTPRLVLQNLNNFLLKYPLKKEMYDQEDLKAFYKEQQVQSSARFVEVKENPDLPPFSKDAIDQLPELPKAVIEALRQGDSTLEEIEKRTGKNKATVAKILSRLALQSDASTLTSRGINSPLVHKIGSGRSVKYALTPAARRVMIEL